MVSTLTCKIGKGLVIVITDFLTQIKKQIEEYNKGKRTKESLGNWAEIEYYKILQGRYLSINELVAYPFFRIISRIHMTDDDMKDEYSCD
ncbi:MAG: hypothetical protein NC124_21450 [Clostridium sp.]|nr:hypothetical protein [Clostridium sp.]